MGITYSQVSSMNRPYLRGSGAASWRDTSTRAAWETHWCQTARTHTPAHAQQVHNDACCLTTIFAHKLDSLRRKSLNWPHSLIHCAGVQSLDYMGNGRYTRGYCTMRMHWKMSIWEKSVTHRHINDENTACWNALWWAVLQWKPDTRERIRYLLYSLLRTPEGKNMFLRIWWHGEVARLFHEPFLTHFTQTDTREL